MIKVSDSSEYSNEEKITALFHLLEAQNNVNTANLKDHKRLQEIVKLQQEQIEMFQEGVNLVTTSLGEIVKRIQELE